MMKMLWAVPLLLLNTSALASETSVATIELEVYSHGTLHYSQILDASGRLAVELVQEEADGFELTRTTGVATIPVEVFEALRNLLHGIQEEDASGFSRREVDSILVMRNVEGEVLETITLDRLSPGRRRLLLDLFSILHGYASDVEIDLVAGDGFSLPREVPDCLALERHLYVIEAGLLFSLFLIIIFSLRRRRLSRPRVHGSVSK